MHTPTIDLFLSHPATTDNTESQDDSKAEEASDDGEEEEEEEEEEEPEDPKEKLEEECKNSKQCAPAKHHFDECVERVTNASDDDGESEDCVEESYHSYTTRYAKALNVSDVVYVAKQGVATAIMPRGLFILLPLPRLLLSTTGHSCSPRFTALCLELKSNGGEVLSANLSRNGKSEGSRFSEYKLDDSALSTSPVC
ncbi:hypothetical protein NPX13_g10566 [Xylaria arbuscula]|uniref:Ubiquinol-cytochrome C reductase hinge domain-containing protein n=1 Tax=Xylaria arbuscula TaxID=114810 RepID=A0A9W8TGG8_9PEZI|nr:hypothetical protein NPX13_g10566 [Xylaria arbuscula]